jgi:hypothetical protein
VALATRLIRAAAGLALALLCSCQPQTPDTYLGEPLLTLQGEVVSSSTLPSLQAVMVWQDGPPPSTDHPELTAVAPVDTQFPARFTVHLYQPPSAAARMVLAAGEVTYARANAAAMPSGTTQSQLAAVAKPANPEYGVDVDHWVIYLEGDVPAGSLTDWWLGGPLSAGFHFMTVSPACLTGAALDACVAELVARGLTDDHTDSPGTARGFCLARYRLAPAAAGEEILLHLGVAAPATVCP